MVNNNNNNNNNNSKERVLKLQLIIDKFEEISLNYGPASSEELKNRINKVIRNFDLEFKYSLENKFELFWKRKAYNNNSNNTNSVRMDVPKFLKNYKK